MSLPWAAPRPRSTSTRSSGASRPAAIVDRTDVTDRASRLSEAVANWPWPGVRHSDSDPGRRRDRERRRGRERLRKVHFVRLWLLKVMAVSLSKLVGARRSNCPVPHVATEFIPRPLPPDPPLSIDAELQELLDRANQALGRLDGITLLLPDPDQFLYPYVRKEAVLSSRIEGTQSSLSDLLLFEADAAPGVPIADARETANYIGAMNRADGRRRLRSPPPPRMRPARFAAGSARSSGVSPGPRRNHGERADRLGSLLPYG